jgi:hypothetical protein
MKCYIIVENVQTDIIENVLMNLANLYANTAFVRGIQLFRKKGTTDSFLILFTNTPDIERFNYFINYIEYPIGFEHHSPFTRGFYRTNQIDKNYDFKNGDWIMVFISKTDKEYDNVHITNSSNRNFVFDFGGTVKALNLIEEKFELIATDIENYNHIIDIYPSKDFEQKNPKSWWKFW